MNKYLIEHHYTYGWHDAEWTGDDMPLRFTSQDEAQALIDEFILETVREFEAGHLKTPQDPDDYRIVSVDYSHWPAWKASRRQVDDLRDVPGLAFHWVDRRDHSPVPGWVYEAETGALGYIAGGPGSCLLILGSSEYEGTVEQLEPRLYEWMLDQGMLT